MIALQPTIRRQRGISSAVLQPALFGAFGRRFLFCILFGLMALTASAQEVVVTLVPARTSTNDKAATTGSLIVTDDNATDEKQQTLQRTASWLYFPANALPSSSEITITKAQLILTRKDSPPQRTGSLPEEIRSLPRAMTIKVASAEATAYPGIALKSADYTAPTTDILGTMQSTERDSVLLKLEPFFLRKEEKRRYIGLLLMPSGTSASRRVYYGLPTGDSSPAFQPRLIITYSYNKKTQPSYSCTSEPSVLAAFQSDGRSAGANPCDFISQNNPPQKEYSPLIVATDNLTSLPAVYGDLLFVVRNNLLSALKPLGGEPVWSLPLPDGAVGLKSLMVVNRFGLLRIVTGGAIYTCQLKSDQTRPDKIVKQDFSFGEVPAAVVPGPDGTLYVVSKAIFALNPDVGNVDAAGNLAPRKLWQVGVDTSASTRITLSPDGRFLYAVVMVKGKSRFIAINAQTGKDVDNLKDLKSFPDNLDQKGLRNPVVARHSSGADYIYIAGNIGGSGILWAVRNTPSKDLDSSAVLKEIWTKRTNGEIGQPILDSTTEGPQDLSQKKLYFLVSEASNAIWMKVDCLRGDGSRARLVVSKAIATNGNPMVDLSGNVMLWANDTLYGIPIKLGDSLPTTLPAIGTNPQLMFGAGGTLYAVQDGKITALIPSFTPGNIRTIESSGNLQIKEGVAAEGAMWTFTARGSVILGNGFTVASKAQVEVKIKAGE